MSDTEYVQAASNAARATKDNDGAYALPGKPQQRQRRSRSGCWTCRRRKVKCDEMKPSCNRCNAAKVTCEGYGVLRPDDLSTSSSGTPLGQRKSRPRKSVTINMPTSSEIRVPESTAYRAPSPTRSSSLDSRLSYRPGHDRTDSSSTFGHPLGTATSSSSSTSKHDARDMEMDIPMRGRSPPAAHHQYLAYSMRPENSMNVEVPSVEASEPSPAFSTDSQLLLPPPNMGPSLYNPSSQATPSFTFPGNNVGAISAFPPLQFPGFSQSQAPSPPTFAPAHTPIDFDSLFNLPLLNGNSSGKETAGKSPSAVPSQTAKRPAPQTRGADALGAPYPSNYWDDQDFVEKMLRGLAGSPGAFVTAGSSIMPSVTSPILAAPLLQPFATSPDAARSDVAMPQAPPNTAPVSMSVPSSSLGLAVPSNAVAAPQQRTSNSTIQQPIPAAVPAAAIAGNTRSPTSTSDRRPTLIMDFAPQPAVDPILQASSQIELHRRLQSRASAKAKVRKTPAPGSTTPASAEAVPTLEQLDLGPPPIHDAGSPRDWAIPANMQEQLKNMENQRHADLLRHYFVNTCPLFNVIDHPKNPFRTFVARYASESLPLLHAVLAVAAINQQPLSVEARAESLLYFEAAVDLYVRSFQQQDDISLFTLLFLSLYYSFDSGTSQSQHFSRRAQGIINERMALLGKQYIHAAPDFKFLVRLHVWYEVMANLARKAGDLRDMAPGPYTLSALIDIIEKWDAIEEKDAGLSGINGNYTMLGMMGVPTFFVSLLNEITLLKEEQAALLQIGSKELDEQGEKTRRALVAKHTRKIRDLECRIQFARPGRLALPPVVASEVQLHRAVSVRFFDLFRLATSIHLLTELQGMSANEKPIQLRVQEMVNLLYNIEQNSDYNTSGMWAFFLAGAAAENHQERSVLHRRLDSTWHSPCGNVWSLRSILDETWQRNAEALEASEPLQSWKDIAYERGWNLLLM